MVDLGFLNINKPQGMTSHDVVGWVRKRTNMKKVGHAGTLDPMATGVLVICWGKATRLSNYVMGHTKAYVAELTFGIETDTYDAEGQATRQDITSIEQASVEAALEQFHGDILQKPPMYSAIKKGGQKLYDLARRGETIELEPRPVSIYDLHLLSWDFPQCKLFVKCSPGTYIRSLAFDIGRAVNVGAHLSALQRTAVGDYFTINNAITLNELQEAVDAGIWQQHLSTPHQALYDIPYIVVDDEQAQNLAQGRFLKLPAENPTQLQAYDSKQRLIALLERYSDYPDLWKPSKVFI